MINGIGAYSVFYSPARNEAGGGPSDIPQDVVDIGKSKAVSNTRGWKSVFQSICLAVAVMLVPATLAAPVLASTPPATVSETQVSHNVFYSRDGNRYYAQTVFRRDGQLFTRFSVSENGRPIGQPVTFKGVTASAWDMAADRVAVMAQFHPQSGAAAPQGERYVFIWSFPTQTLTHLGTAPQDARLQWSPNESEITAGPLRWDASTGQPITGRAPE